MKMPPQEVVQQVIVRSLDHGMSPDGTMIKDRTGLPANVVSLFEKAAKDGVGVGRVRLADRDARGHRLSQTTPLHFMDTTALEIPSWVDYWKLERDDGQTVDLCLVGATRPMAQSEDLEMDFVVIAVFQICDHGDLCRERLKGDTRNIGKKDPSRKKGHVSLLEYVTLATAYEGRGICTLLQCQNVSRAVDNHVTVTLAVNSNRIEQSYSL